jgi:hypothetical protein
MSVYEQCLALKEAGFPQAQLGLTEGGQDGTRR